MSIERAGATTLKGNPMTLVGPELKGEQQAPGFTLTANDLSSVTLNDSRGKIRLLSVVPSLDTPVCDAQTRRFNEEAAKLPSSVEILTISTDLPFAQKRWCGAAGISRVKTLSDHKDVNFGTAYGTLIKELRILSRAIFIVDASDKIRYIEYVKEVANHPNYDAALKALQEIAGAPIGK